MSATLEDCIVMMIAQGKTYKQCEYQIFSTWVKHLQQDGYDILDKYLLEGKFNLSRKEAMKLAPHLFIGRNEATE